MITQSRPGFSILELMVYMAIVAILAAGVFGAFKYLESAKRSRTQTTLQNIKMSIETYRAQVGELPKTLTDLYIKPAQSKRWNGPYGSVAEETDLNDAWGNAVQYQIRPKGSQPPYDLYSWGQKGEGSPDQEWITS
jgi:type II secretion system protein G